MKKQLIIVMFAVLWTSIYSCKKGDTGAQGLQGPQGTQGIQGVKGDNGSMIYSGNDVPAASLGIIGDFYFRLSNATFYGPKTSAGWGTAISLRGSAGATGAAGTKILNGTALPGLNVGAVGDFYFKSDQSLLFGPKTASGWGTGVNLRGATGATGATGTANVIYSGWRTAVRFKDSTHDGRAVAIAHIVAPRITTQLKGNAAFLVYADFTFSVNNFVQLPYVHYNGTVPSTISYIVKTGEIVIYKMKLDNSPNTLGFNPDMRFRYVIIPGGVMATLKNKNIDLKDPFAVDKALQEINL